VPDPDVPLLRWDAAATFGAAVAITTRHGGVSGPPYDSLNLGLHVGDDVDAVVANRARAARAFGVELADLVFARQVHGAHVTAVDGADGGRGVTADDDAVADADVLVTEGPGVTPVIMVADCVPMALVDPVARVLGAVHAGWRGTAAGVVGAALDAMAERGARRERIRAFVGPAVAPERYQVTDEVARALADAVGPVSLEPGVARPDGPGHWLVDLVAANRQQLRLGGVLGEHIDDCGVSTADQRFFSDRAARPCGRFALLARLVD
jgi:purine-nucleoside/S-methyl-5'-thioadenosine phosphorylase / adenosine deaminase